MLFLVFARIHAPLGGHHATPPISHRRLAVPFLGTAGRLYALPVSGAPRLLVVFLRGAYDAANIVVPVSSDFYYAARPNLAIPKDAALPLDGDWGLHPALKDSIYPLWQKKQIAFVPFAGTDDLSRWHFETQDTIELGQPVGGTRDYRSGFMSRTAAALAGTDPIAFTNNLPLSFRGASSRFPISRSTSPASPAWRARMPS